MKSEVRSQKSEVRGSGRAAMLLARSGWFAACCLLAAAFGGGTAHAQGPAAANKMYTNKLQFRLPFSLPDSERQKLKEVQLYVKAGAEPWACKESVGPMQTSFSYKATQDGEYWFGIVTVDKNGQITPADRSRLEPALVVVVDSKPPEMHLYQPPASSGNGGLVCCELRDANPDPGTLRLEYLTAEKAWKPLESVPGRPDLFVFPSDRSWTGVVKATATDRAGNVATCESAFKSAGKEPEKLLAEGPPLPMLPPPAGAPVTPAAYVAPPTETKSEKVAVPSERLTPTERGPSAGRQVVNGAHVALEYRIDQVGASGVGKVEVWMTRDDGQAWQCLCEDQDRKSPVEFDLPGEGTFGVCVVVTNGIGVGDAPPAKGDAPDWWVEVDLTKPVAQLLGCRPGTGNDAGAVFITWTANDKNLVPEPIDLYYSTQRDGPWLPIARGLRNDGAYRWSVPKDVGQELFVRLNVTDRAGNTVHCETPQPVMLDMSRPKAKVIGVSTGSKTNAPPTKEP